jgi:O-antigen/teichoic acid export membrane protein
VAARVSKQGDDQSVVHLMHRSTNLQAIIIFPTMVVLCLFAESLVGLWLGDRLTSPKETVPIIGSFIRILTIGMAARCLSEGWMWIMAGVGKVKLYARHVLAGGIVNPLLALIAIWLAPPELKLIAPAWVYSGLLLLVHLVAIPLVVSREFRVNLQEVYRPLWRPLVVTAISSVVAYFVSRLPHNPLYQLGTYLMVFGPTYLIATLCFVFDGSDRTRILQLLRLRHNKKSGSAGQPPIAFSTHEPSRFSRSSQV